MIIKTLLLLLLSFLMACKQSNTKDISFNINTSKDLNRSVSSASTDEEKDKIAFDNFIQNLNIAITNNERATFASLCRFPFEYIETKEAFINNFDAYFSPELLEKLKHINKDNWFKQGKFQILNISLHNSKVIFQATLKGDRYYLTDISTIDAN